MSTQRSVLTISAIRRLGYPNDGSCLSSCRCDELPCPLLSWLSAELRAVCPELKGDSNSGGHVLLVGDLRKMLLNMESPLSVLASDVLDPFILKHVTEFFVSELQAALVCKYKEGHPGERLDAEVSPKEQRVVDEDPEFWGESGDNSASKSNTNQAELQAEWILLRHALGLDASLQFQDMEHELQSRLAELPGGDMITPLLNLNSSFSSEQWAHVQQINEIMMKDYHCRREMMTKRFQVTLESFAWGEKQKERSAALASVPSLLSLPKSSKVSISHLLAARQDQSVIDPVRAGTSTSIYKVLTGSVPDRGGRPGEIEPPMPAWGDRKTQGNKFGRGNKHPHHDKRRKGKKNN